MCAHARTHTHTHTYAMHNSSGTELLILNLSESQFKWVLLGIEYTVHAKL